MMFLTTWVYNLNYTPTDNTQRRRELARLHESKPWVCQVEDLETDQDMLVGSRGFHTHQGAIRFAERVMKWYTAKNEDSHEVY